MSSDQRGYEPKKQEVNESGTTETPKKKNSFATKRNF